MPTLRDSHGLWAMTAPEAPRTPVLTGRLSADVAVVGAGYAGLSAALHLAGRGIDVVVVEAAEAGFGGAGRNVGLINGGMWVMPDDLMRLLGEPYGSRCLGLLSEAPLLVREIIEDNAIDCELRKDGTLHLAAGAAGLVELRERHRQWTALGAPVELLSREETARRTGSPAYEGALFDPRAGTLQPLAYARGLARAAIAAGADLFTGSPVVAIEPDGARWRLLTPGGSVSADWVVVATDAYSTGPWKVVRDEQVHLPYFNFATEPLPAAVRRSILPAGEGCWDTNTILSSFRMDAAGRLVFGSFGALRNSGRAIHRAWAMRSLRRLFPQLRDVRFQSGWYGSIGMTSDAVPRFHRFAERVVGFSGYNGRGIAPGTVFGKVLAGHVAGEIADAGLPLPVTLPASRPFRALREAYYEAGAQMAHFAGARAG
ncbi:MAG: FAD-binding oxidoreductase [Rhizobiales bacterium]|nr:FAD-binding oxidoreductase [Hyphomicrobiales bacterium]